MSEINFSEQSSPDTPTSNDHRLYFESTYGMLSETDDAGTPHMIEGMEFLGSTVLPSSASTTGALTIAARTRLLILIFISGYGGGGGDIASLRFNADSGNNYWDRHLTVAAGGTTLTNTENASTSKIRLAHSATNSGRIVTVNIMNIANKSKPITISTQTLTAAAGTIGLLDMGSGEWVNTSDQITSIEMLSAGANTLSSGSGFAVYGTTF